MKIGDRVRYTGTFWYDHTNEAGTIVATDLLAHYRVELDSGRVIPVHKHNVMLISPLELLAEEAEDDR